MTGGDWLVPLAVVVIVLVLVYAKGRPARERPGAAFHKSGRSDAVRPDAAMDDASVDGTSPDMAARLEQALGVGLLIQSIDVGPPTTIEATILLDGRTADVRGFGASEADAWRDLARAAMAWKNEDQRNLRIFGGG